MQILAFSFPSSGLGPAAVCRVRSPCSPTKSCLPRGPLPPSFRHFDLSQCQAGRGGSLLGTHTRCWEWCRGLWLISGLTFTGRLSVVPPAPLQPCPPSTAGLQGAAEFVPAAWRQPKEAEYKAAKPSGTCFVCSKQRLLSESEPYRSPGPWAPQQGCGLLPAAESQALLKHESSRSWAAPCLEVRSCGAISGLEITTWLLVWSQTYLCI